MTVRPPHLHVWIPDYESEKGGIQVFSNFFIRALGDCLPDARLTIFSKNDNSHPVLPRRRGPTQFHSAGWWPGRQRTLAYSAQIFGAALRQRPDFILSTHVNFSPVGRWLNRLRGVRYAAVAHGLDVWGAKGAHVAGALRSAERVFAVSRFTRDCLVSELYLDPARVSILPNTFDAEAFGVRPKPRYLLKRFGLQPEQPVILTVGRLASAERYKGYDQILRALPAVRRAIPRVRYLLGGRGRDRARVEELIRELSLEDVVILAGYIPDHELRDFYNLCDVFAMPSKGEGFGIVFLEALASGKPVIAGNQDGSVDALCDGKLGVLIDPDNVTELETALISILERRHPLEILREPERLRAGVIEDYGYAHFVSVLAEYLRQFGLPAEAPTESESAATIC
ncbi:MAG TPA: glycosyltransferase [Chthoniobacteraceae bacterium]|nr:glycosyltransferase [Chthoniobacteraceae bacterium]